MIKIPLRYPRRGAYTLCNARPKRYIRIYGQLRPYIDGEWWYGAYEDDPYNEFPIMRRDMNDIHWRIEDLW